MNDRYNVGHKIGIIAAWRVKTHTQDVILDVPLEIGNLCDAALEQCMQDDFLLPGHQRSATPATEETHLSSHLVTILVAQEPDRPTNVLKVFRGDASQHIQSHLRRPYCAPDKHRPQLLIRHLT